MDSDLIRLAMLPGVIESERPDKPERESVGSAQSGPVVRGKRMKNATMRGSAWRIKAAAGRRRSPTVAERPTRLKPTSVPTKIQTQTIM
jgi:hypothetical protein